MLLNYSLHNVGIPSLTVTNRTNTSAKKRRRHDVHPVYNLHVQMGSVIYWHYMVQVHLLCSVYERDRLYPLTGTTYTTFGEITPHTHNRPATMLTACGRVNSKDKHSLLSAMVLSRILGSGWRFSWAWVLCHVYSIAHKLQHSPQSFSCSSSHSWQTSINVWMLG